MKERSAAWGPAAIQAGVLFFLSATPGAGRPPLFFPGEDKLAHLLLYGVLGMALAWGRHRDGASPPGWAVLSAGVLYGGSDEVHQAFVPGRDPSPGDVAADTVGLLLGYWVLSTYLKHRAA